MPATDKRNSSLSDDFFSNNHIDIDPSRKKNTFRSEETLFRDFEALANLKANQLAKFSHQLSSEEEKKLFREELSELYDLLTGLSKSELTSARIQLTTNLGFCVKGFRGRVHILIGNLRKAFSFKGLLNEYKEGAIHKLIQRLAIDTSSNGFGAHNVNQFFYEAQKLGIVTANERNPDYGYLCGYIIEELIRLFLRQDALRAPELAEHLFDEAISRFRADTVFDSESKGYESKGWHEIPCQVTSFVYKALKGQEHLVTEGNIYSLFTCTFDPDDETVTHIAGINKKQLISLSVNALWENSILNKEDYSKELIAISDHIQLRLNTVDPSQSILYYNNNNVSYAFFVDNARYFHEELSTHVGAIQSLPSLTQEQKNDLLFSLYCQSILEEIDTGIISSSIATVSDLVRAIRHIPSNKVTIILESIPLQDILGETPLESGTYLLRCIPRELDTHKKNVAELLCKYHAREIDEPTRCASFFNSLPKDTKYFTQSFSQWSAICNAQPWFAIHFLRALETSTLKVASSCTFFSETLSGKIPARRIAELTQELSGEKKAIILKIVNGKLRTIQPQRTIPPQRTIQLQRTILPQRTSTHTDTPTQHKPSYKRALSSHEPPLGKILTPTGSIIILTSLSVLSPNLSAMIAANPIAGGCILATVLLLGAGLTALGSIYAHASRKGMKVAELVRGQQQEDNSAKKLDVSR